MVKISPSNAGITGSISGQETKIPHASRPKNQNIKQKHPEGSGREGGGRGDRDGEYM